MVIGFLFVKILLLDIIEIVVPYFSLTRNHVQHKRRYRRGQSNSTFSILRKELKGGNVQSLLSGSSGFVSSSTSQADPLLSSFIFSPPAADETMTSLSSSEKSKEKSSARDLSHRYGYNFAQHVFLDMLKIFV